MPTTPNPLKPLTTPESTGKPLVHEDLYKLAAQIAAGFMARVIRRTYTASSTWTKTTGGLYYLTEQVGAGGGGGGVAGAGSGVGAGGGGGSGAYALKLWAASELPEEVAFTIGTGGPGGVGAVTGTAGGDTIFNGVTAGGGFGGGGDTATSGSSAPNGGAGGTATGGDLNIPGSFGDLGRVLSGANTFNGRGAASMFGPQTNASTSTAANGTNASGYGTGGSGAYANTVTRTGGAGAGGLLIVTIFV